MASTSAWGYGSSGSHSVTRKRSVPDGVDQPAPVGQLRRLDDAGDRSHPEPRVAAAHLLAPLDEHDPELPVAGEESFTSAR